MTPGRAGPANGSGGRRVVDGAVPPRFGGAVTRAAPCRDIPFGGKLLQDCNHVAADQAAARRRYGATPVRRTFAAYIL
ncbi:MAG TPA: hypothetical protein VHS97_07560 [Isosphaeraceae bacterium]|nr:hypothetical protein [Isosphaeraceae bacterium]